MKKSMYYCVIAFAAFLLFGGTEERIQASASEESIIGISSDYLRLYIGADDSLGVIDDQFIEDGETTLFSIDGKTQLLSQFAITNIAGSYVNIRSGPSTDYEVLGRLYPGGIATAVSTEDGWVKIVSGGIEGYIRADFLIFGQEAVDYSNEYYSTHYRVISNTLNLRSSASTDSSIKAQLIKNADLVLLEKQDDWYKVRWNGTASSVVGYVFTEYISNEHKYAVSLEEAKEYEVKNSYQLANIIWPLPADHRISSYFGYRVPPCPGASSFHKGLDIGGAYGLNIVAALSGTVSAVNWDSTSGNYVTIDHGNGVQTKYLHCSKTLDYVGQSVSQGETIAKVGDTGVATGSHLHFSVVINGSFVDPYPYLKNVQ